MLVVSEWRSPSTSPMESVAPLWMFCPQWIVLYYPWACATKIEDIQAEQWTDVSRKEKKNKKLINWYLSMKPEMINMERISQWEITAIDEKSLKKMVKKGKEKKICGVIIDETWKFSFRNQTKGLRCRTYSGITFFYFPPVFQTQKAWGLVGMQYEWRITQKWHEIKYVRIDVPHDPALVATCKVWRIRFQRKLLLSSYV